MSIAHRHISKALVCDECEDEQTEFYANDDFAEMVADAKAEGWKVKRDGDEFSHTCPDCAKRMKRDRAREMFDEA